MVSGISWIIHFLGTGYIEEDLWNDCNSLRISIHCTSSVAFWGHACTQGWSRTTPSWTCHLNMLIPTSKHALSHSDMFWTLWKVHWTDLVVSYNAQLSADSGSLWIKCRVTICPSFERLWLCHWAEHPFI